MSFILDALKKLEQKRQRGSVPDIMTVHMPEFHKPHKSPMWLYLIIAAMLLNAAILGLWLQQPGKNIPSPSEPLVEQQKKPDIKEAVAGNITSAVNPETTLIKPAEKSVNDEKQKRQDPVQKPAVSPAKPQPPAPLPAPPDPQIDISTSVQGIPELSQLPQQVRSEIPPLTILGHIYSDSSTTRMVNINGDILREGDILTNNIRVEEITENGVVLNYNNLRFRIRAF